MSRTSYTIYFHNSPRYWIRGTDFVPYFWNERDGEGISTQVKPLYLTTELDADEELDFIINYDIKYRMGLGN